MLTSPKPVSQMTWKWQCDKYEEGSACNFRKAGLTGKREEHLQDSLVLIYDKQVMMVTVETIIKDLMIRRLRVQTTPILGLDALHPADSSDCRISGRAIQ